MGYEVLDAGGSHLVTAPNESATPVEVIELGPDAGAAAAVAASPSAWHLARARVQSMRPTVLLSVGAALVIGAVFGGFAAGQRGGASTARELQRSQLAVVAQIESSSASRANGTVRIDVTARVTNLGPESVELVSSPRAVLSDRSGELLAEQSGDGERLSPGADATFRLQLMQPCGVRSRRGLSVRLRTADGRTHEVPLRSANPEGSFGMPCEDGNSPVPPVQARLEGTTAHPVLVVTNPRAEWVRVSFASVVSKGSPAINGLVAVLTEPAMPLIVSPGGRGRVTLNVRATRCVQDISAMSQLSEISYPSLIVTDAYGLVLHGSPGTQDIGGSVDISLLVGRALARACS